MKPDVSWHSMAKRRALKLEIEAVPSTSWGVSLRNKLPRTQWDKLRKQVHERNDSKCQICGATEKLHCHELWEYHDKSGVQKLTGLGTICNMCHHVHHFGRSTQLAAAGHLDIQAVITHFLKVNGCDQATFSAHLEEAKTVWERRSQRKWRIDFGEYASLMPSIPTNSAAESDAFRPALNAPKRSAPRRGR